jgi:hypothetical protein
VEIGDCRKSILYGVHWCVYTGTRTCHRSAQDLDGIVVFVIGSSIKPNCDLEKVSHFVQLLLSVHV